MMIDDIMMCEILDAERKWRETSDARTAEENSRRLRRRHARRQAFKTALKAVGIIITVLLYTVLSWLYLVITPDQYSAECEALRAEMEAKGEL